MKSKLTDKHKYTAYILNKEMGYAQQDIADFMSKRIPDGVSQSTVNSAIKEAGYRIEIEKVSRLYEEAKQELYNYGITERPKLIAIETDIINED